MPVIIDAGSIHRLTFGPTIKTGSWYIGVLCRGCGKPILVLEDPSAGGVTAPLVGDGRLSIPCYHCETDEIYGTGEVKPFKADHNRSSFKDKRVIPSGTPRQPLTRKYREAKVTFGIGGLEERPEASAIIARCIAYWTYVEAETARLLSTLLKANTAPAIAVYLSLQNARSKRDALDAAASTTLPEKDLTLYTAIMNYKSSLEKQRADLAHGVFGITAKSPTGVVWLDTTRYSQHHAEMPLFSGIESGARPNLLKYCFLYELSDLETIAQQIEDLALQIGFFIGYLSAPADFQAQRYPQLCSAPLIRKELDLLARKTSGSNRAD